ncbi:MAG: hypothetical protein M3024_10830 [Candidatus Dormibacteraeota bacterium]|nr:hypothetical protein [Candidatus Dormibacteraeota bacterium]
MTRYVETFARHPWRFLALLLALPLLVSAVATELLSTTTAKAGIWVDSPTFYDAGTKVVGWNVYETPAQNVADGLRQLVQTNTFAVQVADRLETSGDFRAASERSQLIAGAKNEIQVASGGSHLVQLTYTCRRPALCAQVLDATIKTYVATLTKQYQAQANAAIDFYSLQVGQAHDTQLADQDALNAYVNSHPTLKPADVALDPRGATLSRQVVADQSTVAGLQTKLDDATLSSATASTILSKVINVIDPPAVVGGGLLGSLPRKPLLIIWAACLGVAAVALVVASSLDRTVRDPRDLERRLGVHVVAEVPLNQEVSAA